MTDRDLNHLCPQARALAQRILADYPATAQGKLGFRLIVTETYRSNADQTIDWQQGRNAQGQIIDPKKVITNAKAGQSAHNCIMQDGTPGSRAFDVAILQPGGWQCDWQDDDAPWQAAHALGRGYLDASGIRLLDLGQDWPAFERDGPHFELANWRLADLPALGQIFPLPAADADQ